MGKYFKQFNKLSDYAAFAWSDAYFDPNISYVHDNDEVYFNRPDIDYEGGEGGENTGVTPSSKNVIYAQFRGTDWEEEMGLDFRPYTFFNTDNIQNLKINGETITLPSYPIENLKIELLSSVINLTFDETTEKYTANYPEEYFIKGTIKSLQCYPKDSNISLDENIKMGLLKYMLGTTSFDDENNADADIVDNKYVYSQMQINYMLPFNYSMGYIETPVLYRINDNGQFEIIDTIVEYTTVNSNSTIQDKTVLASQIDKTTNTIPLDAWSLRALPGKMILKPKDNTYIITEETKVMTNFGVLGKMGETEIVTVKAGNGSYFEWDKENNCLIIGDGIIFALLTLTFAVLATPLDISFGACFYDIDSDIHLVSYSKTDSFFYEAKDDYSAEITLKATDTVSNLFLCNSPSLKSLIIDDSFLSLDLHFTIGVSFAFLESLYLGAQVSFISFYQVGAVLKSLATSLVSWPDLGYNNLNTLAVSPDNTYLDSRNDCNAIINTTLNTIKLGCASTIIPESVTTIGAYSFAFYSTLTDISLPDSITTIEDYAFENCPNLMSIKLPSSLTSIGQGAFSNCSSLSSIIFNDKITDIGVKAFISCKSLNNIIIPDSVQNIGASAFTSCSGLQTIDIGTGVTTMADDIFYGCSVLESIYARPFTAPQITSKTFRDVPKNGTLYYPIGSNYSTWLATNTYYLGYYNWNGNEGFTPEEITALTITYSITTTTQPTKLHSLSSSAASNTFKSMTIDGVKQSSIIDSYTFSSAKPYIVKYELKTNEIPSKAFEFCKAITSIKMPNTITKIGSWAFTSNMNITNLVLSENLISIGAYAFTPFYLTHLKLPSKLETLSTDAFYYTYCLEELHIPKSLTSINEGNFSNSAHLKYITVENGNPVYDSRDNCNCIVETSTNKVIKGSKYSTIPNSIKIIDKYAFQTSSISSLNIPSSVTTIYASSFRGCSLTSLTIDSANPVYDSRNNCNAVIETTTNTLICGTKKSTIPNTVTTIGTEAFAECTLTSIEIPSSVKTIATKAFRNCNNLTGVTFAEGLTSMAEMAFYNSKITKVDLPSTLTSVPASAFTSCQYLAEVVLPETMQSIGDAAFQGPSGNNSVKSLTSVTCYATTAPAITNTTFKYQKNNGILRYPLGSASSYKNNWLKTTEGYLGYYGWTGQTLT